MNVIEKIFTTSGRLSRRYYLMYFFVWNTFIFFAGNTRSLLFEFLTGSSQSELGKRHAGFCHLSGLSVCV